MKFTFDLTEQDYLDFNMFTVKNYQFYRRQRKLLCIILTLIPFGTGLIFWLGAVFRRTRRGNAESGRKGYLSKLLYPSLLWYVYVSYR